MNTAESPTLASFRDPEGRVFAIDGRIFRAVKRPSVADLERFLASPAAQQWIESGRLVRTLRSSTAAAQVKDYATACDCEVYEHEKISFPSYPYEWAPAMLHAAGILTLDLADALLADGLGLKDGTPYNVLFRAAQPVFVDVLSVERREARDPVWVPNGQFIRTFVLPLVAVRELGLTLNEIFLANRDGLDPEKLFHAFGPLQRLRPGIFGLITAPTWLAKKESEATYRRRLLNNPDQARFVVRGVLKHLRRRMKKLEPRPQESTWSNYAANLKHYSEQENAAKQEFVKAELERAHGKRVLDVGCNTGVYSMLAAERGAEVVAIDLDAEVIGRLWRQAQAAKLNILPMVVNLARPTPATGWRNQEYPSFLARSRGGFDLVMMLAVIHHMLVSERVPLEEIISMTSELTRDTAIIEFVPQQDPMFRRLLRGREELHRDDTLARFEELCAKYFRIERRQPLGEGGRVMYALRRD